MLKYWLITSFHCNTDSSFCFNFRLVLGESKSLKSFVKTREGSRTLVMALDRDTPGRPTSCLVFLPRTSNFFLFTFTSNGLFLISLVVLALRTLSARFLFLGAFPIFNGAVSGLISCQQCRHVIVQHNSCYIAPRDYLSVSALFRL